MIHFAKAESNRDEIRESRLKRGNIWDVVSKIVSHKKFSNRTSNIDHAEDTSEKFDYFFANVGKRVYEEVMAGTQNIATNSITTFRERRLFRPSPVDVDKVINIVNSLKNPNSHGPDKITSRFLKDSMPVVGFYLTIIINTSIVTGEVPTE